MSTKLSDIAIKNSEIMAAFAPMHKWINTLEHPSMAFLGNTMAHTAAITHSLENTFRNAGIFDASRIISDKFKKRSITSSLSSNEKWLASIASISVNQHKISKAITGSIFNLPTFPETIIPKTLISGGFFGTTLLNNYTSHLAGLHSTLLGLNAQIALKGFTGIEPDFLEKFTATTAEAAYITKEFTDNNFSTKADITRLETFIGKTLENFKEDVLIQIKSKSTFDLVNLWVAIIGILLTIFTIIQTCQAKNKQTKEYATTQEVAILKSFVDTTFRNAIGESAIHAIAATNCHLRNKPFQKCRGFYTIRAGEPVHVLEGNHKWLRITIISITDSFPITGWVEKNI